MSQQTRIAKWTYPQLAQIVVAEGLDIAGVYARFTITAKQASIKVGLVRYRNLYTAIGATGYLHELPPSGSEPVKVSPAVPVPDAKLKQVKRAAKLLGDAVTQLFPSQQGGRGRVKFDPLAGLEDLDLPEGV